MRTRGQPRLPLTCLLALASLMAQSAVRAAIVRDNTLGTGPVSVLSPAGSVSFNGVNYDKIAIPESYGVRVGANIFHSFKTFDVVGGQGAVFDVTAPAANIISRVTGGNASRIDGLLKVDPGASGSTPNLFLVNPAGVIFGAGAVLDVPAAFHVGTATVLVFPDGRFESDSARVSTLSSADPASFGFSGANPALIALEQGAALQGAIGKPVTVAAGHLHFDGAQLATGAGDLRLAAVGDAPAAVPFSGPLPGGLRGVITLAGNTTVSAEAVGSLPGGSLMASSGELYLGDGATQGLASLGSGNYYGDGARGGAVQLQVSGLLRMSSAGSVLASTFGAGEGGAIDVHAGRIVIDGASSGVYSFALPGSSGKSGDVRINVLDSLSLSSGGAVVSASAGSGNAGALSVSAASVDLSGGASVRSTASGAGGAGAVSIQSAGGLQLASGSSLWTRGGLAGGGDISIDAGAILLDGAGISTETGGGNAGAGKVAVRAGGDVVMRNGGFLLSATAGAGDSGAIEVAAQNIVITGPGSAVGSNSGAGSQGAAGPVTLMAQDQLRIGQGGAVSSASGGSGNAGAIILRARDIIADGGGVPTYISNSALSTSSGNAGAIDIAASGRLELLDGAMIKSDTSGKGNAGAVTLRAAGMRVENHTPLELELVSGIDTDALPGSSGRAGVIDIGIAGHLDVLAGAEIASNVHGSGNGGAIRISADSITLAGETGRSATVTSTASAGATGAAGAVSLKAAGLVSMPGEGYVLAITSGSGNGGDVTVRAGTLELGGSGSPAYIASNATQGSTGQAGKIDIGVAGRLALGDGGAILSGTRGRGDGGSLTVRAGSLAIDGGVSGAEISSNAREGSMGAGGAISVTVDGALALQNGGVIRSDTYATGAAGPVSVEAGSMLIDGKGLATVTGIFALARDGSSGSGGDLNVTAHGALAMRDGGEIASSTYGAGHGGAVSVHAASLTIDSSSAVGSRIASDSYAGASGDAGLVDVHVAGELALHNGTLISTSTYGAGAGGAVRVDAGRLLVTDLAGISATAYAGSSGKTGSLTVQAHEQVAMSNSGFLGVYNEATVAAPVAAGNGLQISAPRIVLDQSVISTESYGNVAAAPIAVAFTDQLWLRGGSAISTQAQDGNGGTLSIQGGGILRMDQSRIVTSVFGGAGNGGDIRVQSGTLLMQTGFIQANTAALNSHGGEVNIQADALLTTGDSLYIGGNTRYRFAQHVFGFNVIQAAAPTGVSGTVTLSTPALDIAGSLTALSAQQIDIGGVGRNPCQAIAGSSLAVAGRGGLAPSARGLLGPVGAAIPPAPLAWQVGLFKPGCTPR